MSELGRHLQFPIRTFHKPNYLKEFTSRLGLYACKEQKGKAVVVCVHAPQNLLDDYRQSHAPAGAWLHHGWLNAVYDAADTGLPTDTDPAESVVPMVTATPTEPTPSPQQGPATDQQPQQPSGPRPEQQSTQHAAAQGTSAGCSMPEIPLPEAILEEIESDSSHRRQVEAERRERVEAEMQTMQPWITDQTRIALDRIRRLLEQLDDAGFLFKSALRRYLKVCALSMLGVHLSAQQLSCLMHMADNINDEHFVLL